ncbi:hypothetical protein FHQ08_12510 [Lactobacillus sp. CC-MHH1034]|uniref:SdrD B-like domain-containing protein n=1 Tax=Agrilactobacillus fermenti TaxID=2586909 RepID=UPI001E444C48|nr:SdrD B-like domain-containing protein [Agrilactobacillus fermenti]MCD2257508.1 hypothetical protein [Agrilactobacillus fermenti]
MKVVSNDRHHVWLYVTVHVAVALSALLFFFCFVNHTYAASTAGTLVTSTYGPNRDGEAPFDSNDDPGYDINANNGIVRSFDKIYVPINLQFDASDQPYTIRFKLTGTIDNGVVANHMLNAKYDSSWGGTYDYDDNSSTFSRDVSFNVTDKNNGLWSQTVPIQVYGATNGTVLTPHVSVQMVSVTQAGATTPLMTKTDLTPPIGSLDSTKVSSQTNLAVAIPSYQTSTPSFNDYANATVPNKKEGIVGSMGFGIGVKPLSGRGTSFLGAAYPDPGTPITINLTPKVTLNGSDVSSLSNNIQTIQFGYVNTPLTTAQSYASLYPNMNNQVLSDRLPRSMIFGSENGQNQINGVYNTGEFTSDASKITFTFDDWYGSDIYPNISSDYSGALAIDPWATQMKTFITSVFNLFLPTSAYVSGQNMVFSILNGGLSYTLNGRATTATKDQTDIIMSASDSTFKTAYTGQVNFTYNNTPKMGAGQTWSNYMDDGLSDLGTDHWSMTSDPALYMGQKFYGWTHYGTFTADAVGGADILEWWNPEESKYDDTRAILFANGTTPAGNPIKPTYQYGVANSANTLANMQARDFNSFVWYNTPAEAEKNGAISAVAIHITQPIGMTDQSNISIPREVITKVAGTNNQKGEYDDPYITLTRSKSYYDTSKSTAYEYDTPYGTYAYTPSTYTNGQFTNHQAYNVATDDKGSQGSYPGSLPSFGATALIEPYLVRLSDFSADKSGYGSQDTAKLSITPKVLASAGADVKDVTVKVTLPKGISYVANTAKHGSDAITPTIATDTNGVTTLSFTLKRPEIGTSEPITFQANFQQLNLTFDANGQTNLNLTAEISSSDDQSVAQLRTKNLSIPISKAYTVAVVKEGHDASGTGNPVVERNQPFNFTVKVRNDYDDVTKNVNVLDKLPQNGVNGSHFSGDYILNNISLTSPTGAATIWYNTAAKYQESDDPDVTKNLELSEPNTVYKKAVASEDGWVQYTPGTELDKKVTAILIHEPSLNPGETHLYAMNYTPQSTKQDPSGNLSGDTYVNQTTLNSDRKVKLKSNTAHVDVVNRAITGNIWHDLNKDGLVHRTDGSLEPGIKGLHVYLVDNSGSVVQTDLNGASLMDVTSDDHGDYRLAHLQSGTYRIGFSQKDMQTLGLMPTKLKADPDDLANSSILDPTQTAALPDGNKIYLSADTYTLPAISEMNGNSSYVIADQNAGFLLTTDYLELLHVPTLEFGKHAVPVTGQTYHNKDTTDAFVKVADTRPATMAQYFTPYDISLTLSPFKTAANQVGLEQASLQFESSDDNTHVTAEGGGTVAVGETKRILEHDNVQESTMAANLPNIKLSVPAASNQNHVTRDHYQATLDYALTLGTQ